MTPIVLQDAASQARVAAHLGFNCFEFRADLGNGIVDVIDADSGFIAGNSRPSGNGIPLLFPFPNRIRGGRFNWEGREYHIPDSLAAYDNGGNAIHGFCLDRPWRVIEQRENFVLGRFQLSVDAPDRLPLWPADFLIDVRYELRGTVLSSGIRIANPGNVPLPWGFGTHPYFRVPLSATSLPQQCVVHAPATEAWELAGCLPSGRRSAVSREKDLRDGAYFGSVQLDDVLTGLDAAGDVVECGIMDEPAGLQVLQQFPPLFRDLVVYTPPGRNSVCLEPYTCVTDAINLQGRGIDAGLQVLAPKDECHTWFRIGVGPIVA